MILSRRGAVNAHQALRGFHRPRPESKRVKCGEDCGVHANADGQRKYGRRCKPKIFLQHPKPITDVLQKCFKERKSPALTIKFLGLFDATELD